MKILVTGATGLLGKKLILALVRQGHSVNILSRNVGRAKKLLPLGCQVFAWANTFESPPDEAFLGLDGVINLMGEPIFKGVWTREKKSRVEASRVEATRQIIKKVNDSGLVLDFFLQASAAGIYPFGEERHDEQSPMGDHYLAGLCRRWEQASMDLQGVEPTILRFPVVLDHKADIIKKLKLATFSFLSPHIGDGRQKFSWIHLTDAVRAMLHCIEKKLRGPVNICAAEPCSMREFNKTAVQKLGAHAVPVPISAAVLGRIMGPPINIVSQSQLMDPKILEASGFIYTYPLLADALEQCMGLFRDPKTSKMHSCFLLERYQFVPEPLDKVWPFFANPANLEAITPKSLRFKILSTPEESHKGQVIKYQLRLNGVPMRWRSEILEYEEKDHFVDYQLSGPYRIWHHLHSFESVGSGTLISDQIHFRLPLSRIGLIAIGYVFKDLRKIFSYRREIIEKLFSGNDSKSS